MVTRYRPTWTEKGKRMAYLHTFKTRAKAVNFAKKLIKRRGGKNPRSAKEKF